MKGQTKKYELRGDLNKDDLSLFDDLLSECVNEMEKEEITELFEASANLRDWNSFSTEKAWDKVKNNIEAKPHINWYKYASVVIILIFSIVAVNYLTDTSKTIYSGQSGKSIVLDDGSDIFIGTDSEIEFDDNFNSKNRIIELKGSAYLDIAKNVTIPFIIKTANAEITVVGTKFYISKQEDGVKVDVLEGKVKISNKYGESEIITDNQSAFISDEIKLSQLDPKSITYDKYPDMEFDNISVQTAIDSLNSIYKSEVLVLNNDIKDLGTETIHATIRNSSVKDFVRFMEIVFDVNVINSKGQYIISSK